MSKVVNIKRYLIQLNSEDQPWDIVDKTLVKSIKFQELKIGDEIEVIERTKTGIIIDFKKINTTPLNINNLLDKALLEQYKKDLKFKCLELSFKAVFNNPNIDIAFHSNRQKAIQHAETLYNEILDKNFLKW